MDILQDMRVFVRVVEAGSFTAAANSMDATPGQTSRAVSDLEAHLRTRLLNRTTRRIAMTEAGERYYDHCMQILALIEQAEAEAGDAHARPCGKLRVRTSVGFGQHYLIKAIGAYQQLYPEYSSQEMGLYAMYLSRQYVDAKIRSWVDYLRDTMPAKLAADQEAASRFIHR